MKIIALVLLTMFLMGCKMDAKVDICVEHNEDVGDEGDRFYSPADCESSSSQESSSGQKQDVGLK